MNMIKKISNKVNGRNYRKLAVKLSLIACTIAFAMCNACMFAFADNAENAKPTGAGGSSTMSNMVDIVFWVVRIIIVLVAVFRVSLRLYRDRQMKILVTVMQVLL